MIIDETFMWLYAAYKLGEACTAFAAISAILCLIAFPIAAEGGEHGESIAKFIWIASLFVLPINILIACITPGEAELKAYAAYAIGKEAVTSNEAKALFNTALKYIEGQTQDKD